MGLTRLAINRPIAILMLVTAFLVLGYVSYLKLPAELNPKVDFGVISVVTTYAGTNPQEMETLVTKPIEDSISGVSGLKEIDSTSQQGISTIRLQFYIGTDLDAAAADVRQKVDAIRQRLPRDADSPVIAKRDTDSQPVMYLAMVGKQHSSRDLRVMADNIIVERLQQAPDIAAVNIFGGDQREVRVAVRRDRLAAYGITISQLVNAIQQANNNVAAGYIQKNDQYASVRFLGEFASVDEIKKLRISLPAAAGGGQGASAQVVNLADIAEISDTIVERTQSSTVNSKDTVTLAIQKTSDGNTLKACNGIKEQIKSLNKVLPPDVGFVTTFDASKFVQDNLHDVVVSLFLGALLAILIVYAFLHNVRATIIIAIAIPTCVISTFLPISMFGFTLNTMTLLGLSLAIGILIDDSIVVLENIVRHLQLGEDPITAAIKGRTEIGLAALTLTMVDLVVFVPITFMGGILGQFFRSFGASISVSVLFSLFVSFTLTPMLASRWFHKGEVLESDGEGKRGLAAGFDRMYGRFHRHYQIVLRGCLRHPWVVVITGNVLLIVVVGFIGSRLGFRFAPGQDQNQVAVAIEAPAGSSLAYTSGIAKQVEERIWASTSVNKDVKYLLTSVGQSNSSGSGNTGTQYANIQVSLFDKEAPLDKLTPPSKREHLRHENDAAAAAKIRKIVASIPGANIQAYEVNGFGGGGAPLTIQVTGTDFPSLLHAADRVKKYVSSVHGVYNTDLSFKASQPEVQIRLDRTRAADYGLSLNQVSGAVSTALQGDISTKFRDPADNNQYNIRIQLNDMDRDNIYSVGDIIVGYKGTLPVHLADVANITLGVGPTRVDRINRLRAISVTGYLMPGTVIGNVQRVVDPELKKMFKERDMNATSYTWGGEAQSMGEEFPYLIQAVFLGILLSYMLMAALFDNLLYPLSVMLTLPQALVGALLALFITGQPFSLIAAIGVIMLNGLAAKNAILMVDYTNTLRERGYRRIDAILEAAPTRLRPILMTSSAIIFATLPTALALGRGAGFRQSLGIVVVGGVLVSTMLTLLVIPCVYLLFDNLSRFIAGRGGRRRRDNELESVPEFNGHHDGDGNGYHPDGAGADATENGVKVTPYQKP